MKTSRTIIVVNDLSDWQFDIPDVTVVDARIYLQDDYYGSLKGIRVFNLCRSYQYQSLGYYVSLLAAARGHKPLPSVMTLRDMRNRSSVRLISGELDEIIQKNLSHLTSRKFDLSVYFGRNLAKRYDRVSSKLYQLFETPLLRASFVRHNGRWIVQTIRPIATNDIPESHVDFVIEAAREFFSGRRKSCRQKKSFRYDLAIMVNDYDPTPPSDRRAIRNFVRAAAALDLDTEIIGRDDINRLVEFDALFIRETTNVNHHTYNFARKAEAENLVVIDDPISILRCTNKVYLAEIMKRYRIPAPRTAAVSRSNRKSVMDDFKYPVILKQPDSSFSQGVIKVDAAEEFLRVSEEYFSKSAIILAQEFVPTEYDWRVGILDRQPLFVCKYYMADAHWQIYKQENGRLSSGGWETLPVAEAPPRLIRLALRAANLIGNGFYGVDIKQIGNRFYVIEINDNPSVESGVEDAVLGEELYRRVMQVFLDRIESRKNPRRGRS